MKSKQPISGERVAVLLVNSALVCKHLARYQTAEIRLERARRWAEACGQENTEMRAVAEEAALCYVRGRLDAGQDLAMKVISHSPKCAAEHQAGAWNTLGNIYLRRCEFEQAERAFHRALEYYRGQGQEISTGICLNNLANINNIRGECQQALELYRQALGIFERHGDSFRTAHVLHAISQMHISMQEFSQAKPFLARSLELRYRMQDYRGIVNGLLVMIGLETDLRDLEAARLNLRRADELMEANGIDDPHLRTYRDGTAGILYFNLGEHDQAERCFLRLIETSEKMGFAEFLAGGHGWLGKNRVFRDRTVDGLADIDRSIELAAASHLPYELRNGWIYRAECCRLLGDRPGAIRAAERYRETALSQGLPLEEVEQSFRQLAGDWPETAEKN